MIQGEFFTTVGCERLVFQEKYVVILLQKVTLGTEIAFESPYWSHLMRV